MATLLSGQTTVAAAGTAVQLHAGQLINGPLMIKALTTNSGVMYVGNVSGDVDSANGMPLAAGEVIILPFLGNLNSLWVDASVNGEKVAWLAIDA